MSEPQTLRQRTMSENPTSFYALLARDIGLNESIAIQKLIFLLNDEDNGKEIEGERWIYNTYETWQKYFPFWSPRTIERTFMSLENMKMVISCQPEGRQSRRKYYRPNMDIPVPAKMAASDTEDAKMAPSEDAKMASSCAGASNRTKTTTKKTCIELTEDALKFADWFKTLLPEKTILARSWREKWAKIYDSLIIIDSRQKSEIQAVCKWARSDSFWKKNFMSPTKLRDRNPSDILYYDVFLNQMGCAPAGRETAQSARQRKESQEFPDTAREAAMRKSEELHREIYGESDEIPL